MMWVIVLFIAGAILVLAEFFVPGGILGVAGALFLIASCVVGIMAYRDYWFAVVAVEVLATIVLVVGGAILIPKTPLGNAMILEDTQNAEAGWVSDETDNTLLGQLAVAFTTLRPAGTILVKGDRIGAVTDGGYIAKGATVRVIEVRGNRVVVEEVLDGEHKQQRKV